MTRRPVVAGNWKMNKTAAQAAQLVAAMQKNLDAVSGVDCVICPPFTSLMTLSSQLKGSRIGLGAQNLHWEASGAFTGEVSAEMVKEFCQYVIIGHSERRAYFGETDQSVNKKVKAALVSGLIPIVCVGETLDENENGKTQEVVSRQVINGLKGLSDEDGEKIIVAYEPVWAIGTGRAASAEMANDIIANAVRKNLATVFSTNLAEKIRILYGGSVKADNAAELFKKSDIDGGLIGGASLKVEDFLMIVKAAA
jgi:triosephosphate isomerase